MLTLLSSSHCFLYLWFFTCTSSSALGPAPANNLQQLATSFSQSSSEICQNSGHVSAFNQAEVDAALATDPVVIRLCEVCHHAIKLGMNTKESHYYLGINKNNAPAHFAGLQIPQKYICNKCRVRFRRVSEENARGKIFHCTEDKHNLKKCQKCWLVKCLGLGLTFLPMQRKDFECKSCK